MFHKFLAVLLLVSTIGFGQKDYKPWIKAERDNYRKIIELSKVYYPGDSKIDVTYYGLDLKITTDPDNLTGNVTIGVKSDTTSLNSCFLDLRNILKVDSVLLNGASTPFSHSNNKINITLDHVYNQDEYFTLKVFYHGMPGGNGFGGFYFSTHSDTPIIASLSESYSGPYWWPQKDTPADKADSSDVWITVAEYLIPVSNGALVSITSNVNGMHTYHWKNHYPIANYLISVVISNYTQYNTYYHYSNKDSMIITNFIYPENFNYVKPLVDETANMIEVFSNRFGEYPFIKEKYGHAEFQWGGAMEHQTCTSMGFWGSGVISHELAHQWFGDKITCKNWHHIWLNEGFATYSEAVYIEAKSGRAAYNGQIQSEMNNAKNAYGTIWVQDVSNENEIFNGSRSYSKGACVLHMLRGIVGDATFFDILKAYIADPDLAYGVATTEDFQAVAERVYGQSLNYFFKEWIYGENYPDYSIDWNYSELAGDAFKVTLTISQQTNTNPKYFTMPVQIKIKTSVGDTTITVCNNMRNQTFDIDVTGEPIGIVLDPNNYILKKVSAITLVDDIKVPLEFKLAQNYPNPFNPSTKISWQSPVSGRQTLKIYNILGNKIATLFDEEKHAGNYQVEFDARNLPSGVYFYTLKAGSFSQTKKMVLLR